MVVVPPRRHPSWVYIMPILHLSACLISMVGHVIPSLQSLGIIWVGILLVTCQSRLSHTSPLGGAAQ